MTSHGNAAETAAGNRLRADDRRWLAAWICIVAAGEAIGFLAPATVGVVFSQSAAVVPLLLIAGAIEGAILGGAQAIVLRQRLPRLRRTAWVALTAASAVVAYAAGMIPSSTADIWTSWAWPAQAALLAGAAVVLLLSIGTAQWLELRRHVQHAAWWIPGTAAAWLVALALFFAIATPLWHSGQAVAVAVLVGVVAGLAMAAVMATITGLILVLLLRPGWRR
jgi:MFS family permease